MGEKHKLIVYKLLKSPYILIVLNISGQLYLFSLHLNIICVPGLSVTCGPDEYDTGYNTCLKKQIGINLQTCPISKTNPPPGDVAQCVGGPGWQYIHIGGNLLIANITSIWAVQLKQSKTNALDG